MFWFLAGQAAQLAPQLTDVAPSSGWTGTGLLGLVLAWVFFKHLPSKDQQIKELLDAHREETKRRDEAQREETRRRDEAARADATAVRAEFKEELARITASTEKTFASVTDTMGEMTAEMRRLADEVNKIRSVQ